VGPTCKTWHTRKVRNIIKNYECSIPLDIVEFFQAPLQVYGVRHKTAIRKQMMTLILTRESTNILISVSVLEIFFRSVSVFHFQMNEKTPTDSIGIVPQLRSALIRPRINVKIFLKRANHQHKR
jgi:hypothetical protein